MAVSIVGDTVFKLGIGTSVEGSVLETSGTRVVRGSTGPGTTGAVLSMSRVGSDVLAPIPIVPTPAHAMAHPIASDVATIVHLIRHSPHGWRLGVDIMLAIIAIASPVDRDRTVTMSQGAELAPIACSGTSVGGVVGGIHVLALVVAVVGALMGGFEGAVGT